ncbi:polymer-forming cytoskeletal protein [Myxococcota bacterium]|nr:polymer-forming cytoskeletal protein [Myxococcota bacterium]
MAISGFGRGKTGSEAGSGAMTSSATGASFGNLTAFIDQGSEFEGKLSFRDTVRIDGTFTGEISSENTLIVGESGKIHATIKSVCVMVSGTVDGDIQASSQIVLHKSAVVNGDLLAPTIVMEEGAQLNGNVRMGRAASNAHSGSAKGQSTPGSGDKSGAPNASGTPTHKPV